MNAPRLPAALQPAWARAQQQWQGLAARERLGLQLAGVALLVLAVYWLGIQPAWRTLRQGPAQAAQLETQLQQMQQWAAEAQALRQLPPVPPAQAQQALKAATDFLGAGARLDVQGERARVSVSELSGDALSRWLAEVRSSARARPIEAQLQRGPRGYSGHIVLALGSGL